MWDMQQGTRNGASAQLMKIVVANLTEEDLVAIAAYVASRTPSAAATPPVQLATLRRQPS
jgi:cytochrome c553